MNRNKNTNSDNIFRALDMLRNQMSHLSTNTGLHNLWQSMLGNEVQQQFNGHLIPSYNNSQLPF